MHKPSDLAGRFQEAKASRFYLFGLTDSEAGAERKRAFALLLTPQELLLLKLKDWSFKPNIPTVEDLAFKSISIHSSCSQLLKPHPYLITL